jgi:hypothetical protein
MQHLEAQDDLMLDLLHRLEEQHREMIAIFQKNLVDTLRPAN